MSTEAITTAIREYFRGERVEMFAILGGSLALVVLAAVLYLAVRDGFARGFGVTALLIAGLLSSTAVSLLRRDPPHEARLVAAVQGGESGAALGAEAVRMGKVIANYPYYRYAALALGVLGLVAVALTRRGWVSGVAAGLLLLVVAQLAIDHYSELRATRYAAQIGSGVGSL